MLRNQQQIDEILHSLDGIRRAEAPPFLRTRINAAISSSERVSGLRAGLATVGLAVLVALNVWVITSMLQIPAGSGAAAPRVVIEASLLDNFQLYDK